MICAVFGLTRIEARTISCPGPPLPVSVNGPAVVGTTIDNPNGPPLYGPVR